MARPKRQRNEAATALVTLAPTTRRRRSQAGYEPPCPVDSEAVVAPKLTRANSRREGNADNTKKIAAAAASSKNDKDDSTTTDDLGNDHAVDEETTKTMTSSQEEQNRMQVDKKVPTAAATRPKDPPQQLLIDPIEASVTESNEVPAPTSEPITADSVAASFENSAKDRIRRVLEHRKVLLRRLIQSRTAAEKRLSLAGKDATTVTDEQETLIFAETMKKVSALARKQAQAENSAAAANNSGEPRRSLVSLRRGNSVGKRMNAAISTLMGSASNNNVLEAGPSFGGVVPMKLDNFMAPETNGEMIPTARGVVPLQHSLSSVSSSKSMKRSDAAALGRSVIKKSHSMAGRSGDVQLMSSLQKTAYPPPPLQHGMHPPHRIVPHASPPPPPRIICPETTALRRRRDQIRSQLAHLIQKRPTTQLPEGREQSPIRTVERKATATPSRPSVAMRIHVRSLAAKSLTLIWQGPELPPGLPPRRQTHWDVVLEEMRWMATDFWEERKWKLATARVLARQIANDAQQKHAHLILPESPRLSATEAPPPQKEPMVPNLDTLSTEVIPMIRNGNTVSSLSSSLLVVELDSKTSTLGQNFHVLSAEDECNARTVAKQISLLVSTAVMASNTASLLIPTSALTEYQKSVWTDGSEMVPATTSSLPSIQSSQTTVDTTLDVTAEKAEMFLRASNRVDSVMHLLANQANDAKKVLDGTEELSGIHLSTVQKEAVEVIEDRWHRIGIGAVLHGSLASGKTVAACALLCRHRRNGPQLLVCSFSNIVRWILEL
jgi:HSA